MKHNDNTNTKDIFCATALWNNEFLRETKIIRSCQLSYDHLKKISWSSFSPKLLCLLGSDTLLHHWWNKTNERKREMEMRLGRRGMKEIHFKKWRAGVWPSAWGWKMNNNLQSSEEIDHQWRKGVGEALCHLQFLLRTRDSADKGGGRK